MNDSYKHRYRDKSRNHVGQTVQLAQHTLVHEGVLSREVTVVVNVMRALVTIGGLSFLRRMVVEGNGEQHWHIDQHQQPGKPRSSVVETTHYLNIFSLRAQK
ncbi:MAG: hypothetical protein MR301_06505 [Prevotella sp.]|nr:hypothetical protein [Prevotella sp.]MDD7046846.1 hypothetical protein [Prevotella sp.]MDY5545946.1 hypothetical protein [Prevotella sp.]